VPPPPPPHTHTVQTQAPAAGDPEARLEAIEGKLTAVLRLNAAAALVAFVGFISRG
jgi:hypothetical protein